MNVKLNCVTQPIVVDEGMDGIGTTERHMKPEEYVIYCARVSNPPNRLNHETAPKLLRSLIGKKHWSPFEMISIGFEIVTSRAIAQQILRHRSFSFQEFSQRYAKVEEIEPIELRMQADKNRQSSTDTIDDPILQKVVEAHMKECQDLYNHLIVDHDVAKECARMVLPLAAQTTIVMHGTLRSWIHFLDQRCSEHAQKEIQEIAFEIRDKLSVICPWTASALEWQEPQH